MTGPAPVHIAAVTTNRQLRDWLAVPTIAYSDDPAWMAPLSVLERRRVSPIHAAFFTFGSAQLFVAYRAGRPVGRISAQINARHLERHRDATGHFGFFDCIDDRAAAAALVDHAAAWLSDHQLNQMIGPVNLSLNDECGCLVEGFDTPSAFMMPHAAPWTGRLLEAAGLVKAIDLLAFRTPPADIPSAVFEHEHLASSNKITVRPFDMSRRDQEIELLVDVFNDAWRDNWGFVPLSTAEIEALSAAMRPIMRGNYNRFVEVDGRPVAFAVALPNLNEFTASFRGRLLPLNWVKLLWKMKFSKARTVRVPLLGIRRAYQSTPLGGACLTFLARHLITEMRTHNIDWIEFSWVLETNRPAVKLAQLIAGPPIKRYRLYTKDIQS